MWPSRARLLHSAPKLDDGRPLQGWFDGGFFSPVSDVLRKRHPLITSETSRCDSSLAGLFS